MAASPSLASLNRRKRQLEASTGKPHVILRASNGECAILSKEYVDSCRNHTGLAVIKDKTHV